MVVIKYKPTEHKQIIAACVHALRQGKTVVYPTDTSYGLACDITSVQGRTKFYRIKERTARKPVHVIVPSLAYAKKLAHWNRQAAILARQFWPGPLSLILPLKTRAEFAKIISAGTGTIGLRLPDNKIARDLASGLNSPITATSANPSWQLSGGIDSYSASQVISQFEKKKHKPDIIIDAGRLPKRRPSTLVKIENAGWTILRPGPISKKQIQTVL